MTIQGLDYSAWRPSSPAQLDGFAFAIRYLSNTPSKNLSAAEARQLTSWGKRIVCVWESTGKAVGAAQGQQDAQRALAQANGCGMPAGRPIYFAVDSDVDPATTEQYRQGVAGVLPLAQIGVYGSAAVCQWWRNHGCGWAWRAAATGWRGGASTALCQLEQTVVGSNNQFDVDYALADDYGGWAYGGAVLPPSPPSDTTPEWRAHHNIYTPLAEDGVWGANTTRALQYVLGVAVDGVFGPQSTRALQALLGVAQDGVLGPQSIRALQRRVGAQVDGVLGPDTITKLQAALNRGTLYDGESATPGSTRQGRAQHNTYTPIAVDGVWGSNTTKALQYVLGVSVDGVFGPASARAFQELLGVTQDGIFGPQSIEALQRRLGVTVDGDLGPQTISQLQSALNHGTLY